MAVVILLAPGYLSSQGMEVALAGCCRAQRAGISGRQGEHRLSKGAVAVVEAGMRPSEGCIGCIMAGTDSWVASVLTFAGDNCSQSSSIQGQRGCPSASHPSSCRT